MQYCWKQ